MAMMGSRIKRLREKRGWTQGQLATYARVNQAHLSRIETGVRENIGLDYLKPIAHALETSIDYLVGLTNDPRPLAVAQSPGSRELASEIGSLLAQDKMEQLFRLLLQMGPEDRDTVFDLVEFLAHRQR